ncbi:MAG: efflux RND transporter periplasmic adaptor subunit [Gammaproteobacteria bacterium]|nr:efflux RND transporter periplasmic adaptor subunit [Gammaproteobacteria bacterium]
MITCNHKKAPAGLASVTMLSVLALVACGKEDAPSLPPLEIPVTTVQLANVPIYLEVVGQTMGSVEIPIRTRVDGVLEGMYFAEGSHVTKGQPLYAIDPSIYQSQVVEAQGRVAEAQTGLVKAQSDLNRIAPLAEMNAVSQQDLDAAQAQFEAAKGGLQAAEARLQQANIEMSYCRINAPIDGVIGISAAKVGEYVGKSPNPVVLNKVSQIDPIKVRFAINEREYLRFRRRLGSFEEADKKDGPKGDMVLILADGSLHQQKGQIITSNAAIDPNTGTLTLEASFPNPGGLVLAGQFARIRGVEDTLNQVAVIPNRAIRESQGLFEVAVIKTDNTVELRRVVPGPVSGKFRVVEEGVQAGERVAVEGLQRLRNGMAVVPKAEESPETYNSAQED